MKTITKTKLIAVEGNDEICFLKALLKNLTIGNIQLEDLMGKSQFTANIKVLPNIPGYSILTKIAFIRDADDNNASSAFESIKSALKNANLPYPDNINEFTDTIPSIGIFIMPNNQDKGMLENLCLDSISEEPVNNCISDFLDCLIEKPKNIAKAKVLCYLASKHPTVNSLGLGAMKGYWNFESDTFTQLKEFLKNFED